MPICRNTHSKMSLKIFCRRNCWQKQLHLLSTSATLTSSVRNLFIYLHSANWLVSNHISVGMKRAGLRNALSLSGGKPGVAGSSALLPAGTCIPTGTWYTYQCPGSSSFSLPWKGTEPRPGSAKPPWDSSGGGLQLHKIALPSHRNTHPHGGGGQSAELRVGRRGGRHFGRGWGGGGGHIPHGGGCGGQGTPPALSGGEGWGSPA